MALVALVALAACGTTPPAAGPILTSDTADDVGADLGPDAGADAGADAAEDATPAADAASPDDAIAGDDATPPDDGTAGPDGTDDVAADVQGDTAQDADTADTTPVDAGPDVPPCDPAACDDGKPCTNDKCDGKGGCTHEPVPGCSDALAPCAKTADCKSGVCDPALNACVACLTSQDCAAGSLCSSKKCVVSTACKSDAACKTTNQVCSLADGACVDCNAPADCQLGEACSNHKCVPAPVACQSSKDCPNVCDKSVGACVQCLEDGDCPANLHCADKKCVADVCSGGGTCAGAQVFTCKANGSGYEAPKTCSDGNPCTDDGCEAPDGCEFLPNSKPCDDGNACTQGEACKAATCQGGVAVSCDDKNPCTTDACLPTTGCGHAPNSLACDDGDACTSGDTCQGGACKPAGGKACDDGNPCTDDSCAGGGCKAVANTAACNDGNPCTSNDVCVLPGAGNPNGGKCTGAANAAACDDGKPCTTGDKCAGGVCTAGAAKVCTDGDACTDDSCDAATGACKFVKKPGCGPAIEAPCQSDADCKVGVCDKALQACVECVTSANCKALSICQKHLCKPAPACASDTQCKATNQVCNVGLGACVDCNGNPDCAADQLCVENACVAAPGCQTSKDCPAVCNTAIGKCVECNSSLDCAAGKFCNAKNQCELPLCKAGSNVCLAASQMSCKSDGGGYTVSKVCNDGNTCTTDVCDAQAGCLFQNNTSICKVSDACIDQCQAGSCVAKGPWLFEVTKESSSSQLVQAVTALSDGGWLLSGRHGYYSSGNYYYWLWFQRHDQAGKVLWEKTHDLGSNEVVKAAVAKGEGAVVTGQTGSGKFWLAGVDGQGNLSWQQSHASPASSAYAQDIVAAGDGYAVIGYYYKGSYYDGWLLRTDAQGKGLWSQYYSAGGTYDYHDELSALAATKDGGFAMVGRTNSKGNGGHDLWLVKTNENGFKTWDATFGGTKDDGGAALAVTADGGYAVAGYRSETSGYGSMWLMRLDATGKLLWEKVIPSTASGSSAATSVLTTADGGLVAHGYRYLSGTARDLYLVRLSATGSQLWDRTWSGTTSNWDEPGAVAHASNGGFAVGAGLYKYSLDPLLVRTDAWGHSSCPDSGFCAGLQPADCDDGNPCTLDACQGTQGCVHTPGC